MSPWARVSKRVKNGVIMYYSMYLMGSSLMACLPVGRVVWTGHVLNSYRSVGLFGLVAQRNGFRSQKSAPRGD